MGTMNNGVSTEISVPLLTQASNKTVEESQEDKFLRLSLNTEPTDVTELRIRKFLTADLDNTQTESCLQTSDQCIRLKLKCPISGYDLRKETYLICYEKSDSFQPLSGRGLLDLEKARNSKQNACSVNRLPFQPFKVPKTCPLTGSKGQPLLQPLMRDKIFKNIPDNEDIICLEISLDDDKFHIEFISQQDLNRELEENQKVDQRHSFNIKREHSSELPESDMDV